MFEYKPDYEQTKQRIEAFWKRDVLDRPVVQFTLAGAPAETTDEAASPKRVPLPVSGGRLQSAGTAHATPEERWLDVDYQVARISAEMANHEYLGDTLPVAVPLLGPELFSAFYGCPLHFSDHDTSWSDPILHDWSQAQNIHLDWDNFYLKKMVALTNAFIEAGRGKWITGMTDWHPGGDGLAAFRDPQNLAIDLVEHPIEVKAMLTRLETDYFAVYDFFFQILKKAGLPATSWVTLVADGKFYIPSNDFSIMISKAMFDEFFLAGIQRECQFLDHSIYHLDGPGALRHLDSILSIPELDAVQWVPGDGNKGFRRWVWVYQKIQQAGKGIEVICSIEEIDAVMETLDPRGVFLYVENVPNHEAGQEMLKKLGKWHSKNK